MEGVTHWLCISEVLDSILGQDNGYSDRFSKFSSVRAEKRQVSISTVLQWLPLKLVLIPQSLYNTIQSSHWDHHKTADKAVQKILTNDQPTPRHSLSPSREAVSRWATQEFPSILRNPNVHCRVQESPPPVSILRQIDPVHVATFLYLEDPI